MDIPKNKFGRKYWPLKRSLTFVRPFLQNGFGSVLDGVTWLYFQWVVW